jgi:DegV family protein with EDD domain
MKMKIKLVTDSTCDLPIEVVKKYEITVVPVYINFQDGSFLDGVDITRKEFYNKLPNYETPPTTSAPSVGTFVQTYKDLIEEGATTILSIHISSTLSGIFNVASLASESFQDTVVKTFDPGQLSLGTGLIVEAAAKMAQAGESLVDIIQKIRSLAERTYTFATLDTLKYLQRSGRISRFKSSLGSLLQVKPLLKMHIGHPSMEAIRTSKASLERLLESVRSLGSLEQLALVHTNAPERAEHLRELAPGEFPMLSKAYSTDVTPVIGSHIGPGAVGFAAIIAE